jgi:hypothetical protein
LKKQRVDAGIKLVPIGKNIFPIWTKLILVTTELLFDPELLLWQRVALFFNVFQNIWQPA